jgi:hypothetical protein
MMDTLVRLQVTDMALKSAIILHTRSVEMVRTSDITPRVRSAEWN